MYAKVKQVTRTGKAERKGTTGIADENGELLTEMEDIKMRWKDYIEKLYDSKEKPKLKDIEIEEEVDVESDDVGPDLLESQIKVAIKDMKMESRA